MVQLTLPKNSKVKVGKTWPKPTGASNVRKFQIYRWNRMMAKTRGWIPILSTWTNVVR